jgi:hypothetical protein
MKVLVTMGFDTNEAGYSALKRLKLWNKIDDCMEDISEETGWESEFFEINLDKSPDV